MWSAFFAVFSRAIDLESDAEIGGDTDLRLVAAVLIAIPVGLVLMHLAWTFIVARVVPSGSRTKRLGAYSAGLFALLVVVTVATLDIAATGQVILIVGVPAVAAGLAAAATVPRHHS